MILSIYCWCQFYMWLQWVKIVTEHLECSTYSVKHGSWSELTMSTRMRKGKSSFASNMPAFDSLWQSNIAIDIYWTWPFIVDFTLKKKNNLIFHSELLVALFFSSWLFGLRWDQGHLSGGVAGLPHFWALLASSNTDWAQFHRSHHFQHLYMLEMTGI